jgi:hypothetical protein
MDEVALNRKDQQPFEGVNGFDFGRRFKGSGPRMSRDLVNHFAATSINADNNRLALAA